MNLQHLDAITTLAVMNFRALAAPDLDPRIRSVLVQCDDVLDVVQNAVAGDVVELGTEDRLARRRKTGGGQPGHLCLTVDGLDPLSMRLNSFAPLLDRLITVMDA